MKNFKKIINPCTNEVYIYNDKERPVNSFCKIEYQDGQLSITGVIDPKSNGNSWGSCGQCVDEIRKGVPTKEWTSDMLQKFCDIWDEWHLNDMRPYCKHMKELGWDKLAKEKVEIKTYKLTMEAFSKQQNAKRRALKCLKSHEGFFPTWEETICYILPYEQKTYNGSPLDRPEYYEFKEINSLGDSNIEYKIRGHMNYEDNELGLLGKECPICGYKYGHSWIKDGKQIEAFLDELIFNEILIPKKVLDIEFFGSCPNCYKDFNSELMNEYDIQYCPWCGQKLDWTEN